MLLQQNKPKENASPRAHKSNMSSTQKGKCLFSFSPSAHVHGRNHRHRAGARTKRKACRVYAVAMQECGSLPCPICRISYNMYGLHVLQCSNGFLSSCGGSTSSYTCQLQFNDSKRWGHPHSRNHQPQRRIPWMPGRSTQPTRV